MKFSCTVAFFLISLTASSVFAAKEEEKPTELLIKDSYIVTFKPTKANARAVERSPVLPALSRAEMSRRAPVPFGTHTNGQSKEKLATDLGIRGKVVSIFDTNNAVHLQIDAEEAEKLRKDP